MERKRSSRRYLMREKTFAQKCKDYLRQFIAFMFSNVGIIGLVVGYTIGGAFFFKYIEGSEATKGNIEVMQLRDETVERLWNFTFTLNVFEESEAKWTNSVTTELEEYQEKVVAAIWAGFDGSDNVVMAHQWSFAGAFLYSLTVITTIGYGNVTPRTTLGKIATIFYAIAGMPLFLLYLSNIGDILARSFKWLYARCCLCKCCPKKRKKLPPPAISAALKTLAPRAETNLHRGNSDRTHRQGVVPSRLHGSLSLEDGVNIGQGRRDLDGFGRRFVDREFNERNHRINGDDQVFAPVNHVRRASSIGDVTALNKQVPDEGLTRGGSERLRRAMTRQEEMLELNDFGVPHKERPRRPTDKDVGMSKAELVLGMNDLGLEYLDLPKKRGPLQRVFGRTESRVVGRPDVDYSLGIKDTSRFDGYAPRVPDVEARPAVVEAVTTDDESDEEGSEGSEGEFDSQTVTVPVTLCLAIMVGYVFGGAMLFAAYEGWNLLDGSYFCFISLSTIGFGDIVPGDIIRNTGEGVIDMSFIFCSMYLMLGMAMIAMCFNLMQEEVVHKMRSCAASLRHCMACAKRSVLPAR